MPKNVLKYVIYASIAIAVGLTTYLVIDASQQNKNNNESTTVAIQDQNDQDYITYSGVEGEDALTTLKNVNDKVVTKTSDFGEYVDSINGLVGGTDGKYWSFYVDGKLSDIGAGSYISNGGEKIEWKFINLQ